MENKDTGILLDKQNLILQRQYFEELVRLKGINVVYRAPRKDKHYDGYGELFSYYQEPEIVGCIFQDHVNQWTMRKLGWNSELSEGNAIIHVPYNLHDLQSNALFVIPSGLDNTKGRVFKVIRMSNIQVFPASIACEIGPVYDNTFDRAQFKHEHNTFSLLKEEEE